jgi:putative hydrolase of the HAD superfamily
MDDIRFVYFDMGGVLVDVDLDRLTDAWTARTDAPASALTGGLFDSGLKRALDSGDLGPDGLAAAIGAATGRSIDRAAFEAIWNQTLLPRPASDRLVRRLRGRVRTGLLSNTDPMHHAWARENTAVGELTVHVTSYACRSLKPDQGIYEAAIAASGEDPARIAFADDRADNVEAARALGIRAVQVTSAAELGHALAGWGLADRGVG